MDCVEQRREAIRRFLQGESPPAICASLQRSLPRLYKWWARYEPDDEESLHDGARAPHRIWNRTSPQLERMVVQVRQRLVAHATPRTRYTLVGAPTIQRALRTLGIKESSLPSPRTIERILRHHACTGQEPALPVRPARAYPTPPARFPNQVQQFDLKGPLYLKGSKKRHTLFVLKDIVSRAIFLGAADNRQAGTLGVFLVQGGQEPGLGLPQVLQMDNARELTGRGRYSRTIGQVVKLCLYLGIEPLFIPEQAPCRNGSVENCNGWVEKLLVKGQQLHDLPHLRREARKLSRDANIYHPRAALGCQTAQEFRQRSRRRLRFLPPDFVLPNPLPFPRRGKISFMRQVRKSGRITLLGERAQVSKRLAYEYVYVTLFVKEQVLRIFREGELYKEIPFSLRRPRR